LESCASCHDGCLWESCESCICLLCFGVELLINCLLDWYRKIPNRCRLCTPLRSPARASCHSPTVDVTFSDVVPTTEQRPSGQGDRRLERQNSKTIKNGHQKAQHGGQRIARALSDLEKCIVCMEHDANACLIPCEHSHFCHACAKGLVAPPRCPLCRAPVGRIVTYVNVGLSGNLKSDTV